MASPSQLVETLSAVTGLPLASVVDLDRRLAKAGLRGKSGRGLNVARMTPRDAAHLLTALLASSQANQAEEAVRRYGATRIERTRSSEQMVAIVAELAQLGGKHGFIDGLASLILSASSGSLADALAADERLQPPQIEVTALTRTTLGRIRITGLPDGMTASLEYVPLSLSRLPSNQAGAAFGDLEQLRRVTGHTIYALAALFAE